MSVHVSTPNPTSIHGLKVLACIDKLSFYFERGLLPVHKLLQRAKAKGLKVTEDRLRKRWYYKISAELRYLFVSKPADITTEQSTTKIITNPSGFDSYRQYRDFIDLFFTGEELNLAKVSRLDLAVDYFDSFKSIFRGLDCKYKIKSNRYVADIEYMTKGSLISGLMIGGGSEKFVIYDHQLRHRGNSPRTRVECQLSGEKCPVKNYSEITELPRKLRDKNPFDSISVNQIHLRPRDLFSQISHEKKLIELKASIDCVGYLGTRKILNKNKNFKRDYQKYFHIQPLPHQPNKVIEGYISNYFKNDLEGGE